MKLFQLHYFCTACAYRNITRAAAALHVSQPAVSMAIQALESEFGLALLDRSDHGFALTPDGEFFYREAQGIISRGEALAGAMEERKRLGAASLRFGSTPMAGAGVIQKLFKVLGSERSPLSVNLVEGSRGQLLRLLDEGLLDFAFMPTEALPAGEYDFVDTHSDEIAFCTAASSPLARLGRLDSASQIAQTPLALFDDKFYLTGLVRDLFSREGLTPNIICRSAQIFTVVQFVRSGAAAAFLNSDVAGDFPDIVRVPLREPMVLRVGFVWKKGARSAELESEIRGLAAQLGVS